MRVGVDFDNTIVCYDTVFHGTAVRHGLISAGCGATKTEVRDFLRQQGREDDWTVLQGLVYSAGMTEAAPFAGVVEFLRSPPAHIDVMIVSHRTRKPYRGDADLHAAARDWIARHQLSWMLDGGKVHFEESREAKFAKLDMLGCEVFIDDLPEFLVDPAFPRGVRRILFDPGNLYPDMADYARSADWDSIVERLGGR